MQKKPSSWTLHCRALQCTNNIFTFLLFSTINLLKKISGAQKNKTKKIIKRRIDLPSEANREALGETSPWRLFQTEPHHQSSSGSFFKEMFQEVLLSSKKACLFVQPSDSLTSCLCLCSWSFLNIIASLKRRPSGLFSRPTPLFPDVQIILETIILIWHIFVFIFYNLF